MRSIRRFWFLCLATFSVEKDFLRVQRPKRFHRRKFFRVSESEISGKKFGVAKKILKFIFPLSRLIKILIFFKFKNLGELSFRLLGS